MDKIYLDNGAVTKPSQRSLSAMLSFLTDHFGSPLQPHQERLAPFLEKAYRSLYRFVGSEEKEHALFVSSGVEAVNQAVQSVYHSHTLALGKNQFLTSVAAEAAELHALQNLEKLNSVTRPVAVDSDGIVTREALLSQLTARSAGLFLSRASLLTGVIQPLDEIAELAKERGIHFHLNASSSAICCTDRFSSLPVDSLSFEGSLLHAPQGSGALFWKSGLKMTPLLFGGMQQGGGRGGPFSMPLLMALAEAAEEAIESKTLHLLECARLRTLFEEEILAGFPDASVISKKRARLPHITALLFPKIANEALLFHLFREGVLASIGGGDLQQISLVLEAQGYPPERAQTAVSFSLSRYTTEEEIREAAKRILRSLKKLSKLSAHLPVK